MPGRGGTDIPLGGDLAKWLEGAGDDAREVIVEARTPTRIVRFDLDRTDKPAPVDIQSSGEADRAQVIRSLRDELSRLTEGPATALNAAGAVVVRANREQLREILGLPQVKAVRPNRPLKRPT